MSEQVLTAALPPAADATPAEASASVPAPEQTESPFLGYAIQTMITLVLVGVVLFAYHHFYVAPNKQRIAVLDVREILELKQMQLATDASRPGLTDSERSEIFDKIGTFSGELERAVEDLQAQCGCTLLVRAAVVRPGTDDLTTELKVRLGLGDLKTDEMLKRFRSMPADSPRIPPEVK